MPADLLNIASAATNRITSAPRPASWKGFPISFQKVSKVPSYTCRVCAAKWRRPYAKAATPTRRRCRFNARAIPERTRHDAHRFDGRAERAPSDFVAERREDQLAGRGDSAGAVAGTRALLTAALAGSAHSVCLGPPITSS